MTEATARRRAFGAAAAAVALVLSACGGAGEGGGVASAGGEASPAEAEDTVSRDEEAQALAFAECMRDNGVDMPDPGPGQQGLREAFQHGAEDQATIDEALAACEDLRPQREHDDGQDEERDEDMLELAECLREQGLDVPDNLFESGAMHDVDQDELSAAMEECRDLLPGGGR